MVPQAVQAASIMRCRVGAGSAAAGDEEDEVAGLFVAAEVICGMLAIGLRRRGDVDSGGAVGAHGKAGAVEAARAFSAPDVGWPSCA